MSNPTIKQLDQSTIEQIAAGEVVERPASVVKELLENSLDAGASRITVEIDGDGSDRITVRDDGHGMAPEALERAVKPHTTSKISTIDDLEAGVSTLGFRGEALHTIGSVSKVTITSSTGESAPGATISLVGGEIESTQPAGRARGTTATVEDLFFNTPARRKFLKQPATEFDHIGRVVKTYALGHPDVAITLEHDDREVFSTPGRGTLEGAILAVYGREVAEAMREVEATELEGPIESISGVVSHPEVNRASQRVLTTFVNGRYVPDETIRSAIQAAYDRQLASDRYPFAVIDVTIPPSTIDVNVHPRKLSIRYDDEAAVGNAVESAVQDALLEDGLIRTAAPRGRSAKPETTPEPASEPSEIGSFTETAVETDETDSVTPATPTTSPPNPPSRTHTSQWSLSGEEPETPTFETLPDLEIAGQLADTYLVGLTANGILLIDQHAADERINYERLKASLEDAQSSQQLATPVELSVTALERIGLDKTTAALETAGFVVRETGDGIAVEAVPAAFSDALDPATLRTVLDEVLEGADASESVEAIQRGLLADLACYPSITGNTSLTDGSMTALLEALDGCEDPYSCPHGRPVIIEITTEEIEDRFERDYPGHH